MFAGHFGLAAGIRALDAGVLTKRGASGEAGATAAAPARREVPLWALMLSTQLLDVGFVILVIAGVESFGGPAGYGDGWIHAYYTHSLTGALLIAAAAGLLGARWWGRRGGLIVGATVFSHWLLDLLVHRPDLPILPGNLGNLPQLGFGLWNNPAVSLALEGLLVVVGGTLYAASVLARTRALPRLRGRALAAGSVMGALLVLALVTSALGIG